MSAEIKHYQESIDKINNLLVLAKTDKSIDTEDLLAERRLAYKNIKKLKPQI